MLNINKKLLKKGFSLIELMIAAAILAMAIFGIFHAYSAGFMGMAGARDRTVATNYAREAMEDIKNMDFEKITTTTKSVISSNTKYRVDVNVSSESANLKKVITVVSWKDRNGTGKTVETTMLVNFIEVYASEAAKIVLFADSYTILNTGTTELTAIIKDIKGNTIIDWNEGDITFSILSGGEFGILSPTTVTPDNGIAKTTFSTSGYLSEGEIGYTVIKASVNLPIIGNVSDQITIKVTDGPVKIMLSADPDIIKAVTENYSTITVSLCDAANQILNKSDLVTDVEITFSVFGEGNLSTSTITIPAIGAEPASAEIILNSTGTPGLASLMATATNLESGKIDVRFLGPPVSILITASPNPIYVDDVEGSTVTVSLLDVKGFSTNPTEGTTLVNFTLSPDSNGFLSPSSLTFTANEYEGILLTTLFSGQTSTDPVTITASAEGLAEDFITINILSELIPDHIELIANPQNVIAGGTSTITATVYDVNGKIVSNYTGTITFKTTLGVFSNNSNTIIEDVANGKAITVLTSSSDFPGNAIITIIDSTPTVLPFNPSDGVVVGFYGGADHIELTASSQNVKIGEGNTSTITATVCDSDGIRVTNYNNRTITFFKDWGTFSGSNPTTTSNGIATIELYSNEVGTATINAVSWYEEESRDLTSEEIEIVFYEDTTLTLVDGIVNCTPTCDIVTFDVKVTGENIEVDEMNVSWGGSTSSEKLYKIEIRGEQVYSGNVKSDTNVDINNNTIFTGEPNISNIKLTFGQDMAGKTITVVFYPVIHSYTIVLPPL